MIAQENITINDVEYVKTYSDSGYKIHGGVPESDYDEAIDLASLGRTYTETEIPIEEETDAEEIVNILTGDSE